MSESPNEPGFEQHLQSVEEAIRRLETGEIPLEESIELYAEAMQHLRACHGFLESAEARLEIVRRDGGVPRAEDAGDDLAG
jgi:exodeoxyribonuclease VII small subunit